MKNNLTRLVNNHLPHNFNSKTLHVLDFVASGRLLGIDVIETPTSPSTGDAYHTSTDTTGLWSTLRMNDQLVVWTGSAWSAVVPYIGFTARVAGLGQRVYVGGGSLLESSWRETGTAGSSVFRQYNITLQPFEDDLSLNVVNSSATGQIIPGGSLTYYVNWDRSGQYYPLQPPGVGGGIKKVFIDVQNETGVQEFSNFGLQIVAPQGLSGQGANVFPSEYDAHVSYPYYPIQPFSVSEVANPGVPIVTASAVTDVTLPFVQSAQNGDPHAYNSFPSVVNEGARGNGWLVLKVSNFNTSTSPVVNDYPATVSLLLEQEY